MRLIKGDPVIVIAGNEKGKEGKILDIRGDRVVVQGVNKKKKHQKPQREQESGKIVEFEAPIHVSNVMYSHKGEGVKLRARLTKENKKEIFCRTKNREEQVIRTVG